MASKGKTRLPAAIQNGNGGACALAGYVRIVHAVNAVLAAGVFALAVRWGYALPAAGAAAAAALSALMAVALRSKGGAA